MENRVYYGEYSLKHWVDLMLKNNIVLPDYQRKFVWKREQVINLIESIKKKEFVPPVIIGYANIKGENKNLIIDGQQRLTSLLLFWLNKYPAKSAFRSIGIETAVENEDDDIDDSDTIDWRFDVLLKNYPQINDDAYINLYDAEESKDFFEDSYLGFSYIVPNKDATGQSKYYSSVFKHINESGNKLSKEESRRALYFLDDKYTDFFDTKALDAVSIIQQTSERKADFVRYVAMLTQLEKCNNTEKIAVGYGSSQKREDYYAEYINSIVENQNSELFGNFEELFPNGAYKERLPKLQSIVSNKLFRKQFKSIIDADFYLFGLIYYVLFKNVIPQISSELNGEIELAIEKTKQESNFKIRKAPNALNYTQQRIKKSVEIYSKYVDTL